MKINLTKRMCVYVYVNHLGLRLGTAGLRLGAWQIFGMLHVGNDNEHGRVTTATTTNTSTTSSNIYSTICTVYFSFIIHVKLTRN